METENRIPKRIIYCWFGGKEKPDNIKECSKYLDIPCQFELKEDETLFKFKDNIIAYKGKTIITNYHKYFTLSGK